MHREITYADRAFGEQESRLSLYLLTGLIGLILAIDLWPWVANGLVGWGLSLPSWPNEISGYRIALIAAILGGARVLYNSLDSLLQGRLGADLALAIACVAAILLKEPLVAAELVFVGLIGECLEHFTFARTQQAVRKLAELTPQRCWRLRDGQEERVLVRDLQVGDQIVVKPGAKVPVDGVVLAGRSALDTSALTGESLPVDKGPGDEVLAGSLNQHGALTIEARRLAEHTILGRVIEMTARAMQDRAPSERTADRLARYFLPVVLLLAGMTFVGAFALHSWGGLRAAEVSRPGWAASLRYAVYPALSVLVVACPCALILATPAAVLAALGRLAGTGVLLKGGSALERLAKVNAMAFDKTGTLTEGRLELGEVHPVEGISVGELVRLAASAEQASEHPIARLLVEQARGMEGKLEVVEEFLAHPGSGVSAKIAAGDLLVGNRRLLEEKGVSVPQEVGAIADRLDAQGQTVLFVCLQGRVLGVIGARDRVRLEARAVLEELRQLGIKRLAMLTGDRAGVARPVGEMLGISEIYAELMPEQKAERIASWQTTEQVQVAMVGDGINDAPALVRANVGLAIGGTSHDVAAEAGDIVLMIGPQQTSGERARDPLRHLPMLVRLSRETVRIIRQNILVFAFGVNLVGIVLTAWLWPVILPANWHEMGPLAAVIYHQVGSLLVLLNSMRLLWFQREGGWSSSWADRLQRVNDWLERRLDLDEGLHWLVHRWPETVSVGGILILMLWLGSGLVAIRADEIGIVQRFGRPQPEDLTPGLHWRWPWPLETVRRIQPEKVRTLEIGYRIVPGGRLLSAGRSWSSAHAEGLRRDPDEAVMVTGDGNLLELQGSVRYTIAQPRVYLFEVNQAEQVLRQAAESVLREVVASRKMAELLTAERGAFQQFVQKRLQDRCEKLRLGLRLEGVSLHDLHPPQEVVQEYHDVTRAMERRDREVNLAEEQRTRRLRKQEAESQEILQRGQAEKFEKIRLAEARRQEFQARQRVRVTLSWPEEVGLLLEASEEVQQGMPLSQARQQYREKRRERLAQQQALTDYRLYWDALTEALSGRAKVLVDAEKLPGRRSLWLVPFEPMSMPMPMPGISGGRGRQEP